MKINIFGSTGNIGSKTLKIISNHFPDLKVNLLCCNNNVKKLIRQIKIFKPKFVYVKNENKFSFLKKNINRNTTILNFHELISYLQTSKSDYSILAISGYKSLNYFEAILKNTSSLGLVSKEAIVSVGHLFKTYDKKIFNKIYPLDSEHFSIFYNLKNKVNIKKLILTASGGPFLGKKYSSLSKTSFSKASNHPKWNMGYKNSIDSATLVNKCLELIEAHYLFNIPYNKLNIIIHPESKIHSIFEYENHMYNMIAFHNDMTIPIYHFLNQRYNFFLDNNKFKFKRNIPLHFTDVNDKEFPIYKYFNNLDKSIPSNIIKFNVANEFAVNLFKDKLIKYTDIFKIIAKITSLNLNYKLNNINDILDYHNILENKINEKYTYY